MSKEKIEMTNTYAKAYTEVLEILKYLPKEEYNKISKEKIQFYKKNKDDTYVYIYDTSKTLEEQKVSRKTKVIIISLFNEFFATSVQKEKLKLILKKNEEEYQTELSEMYDSDNLFKKKTIAKNDEELEENNTDKMLVIIEKENIFKRIINKIKRLFIKK